MARERCSNRIYVTLAVYNAIIKRAHYGQTPGGVVKELLDLVDKIECKPSIELITPDNDKLEFVPKEKE
jgi:hypothetical protein